MSVANARIQLKRDTTAQWNAAVGMIPLKGEVIIYEDHQRITQKVNGVNKTITIPGIKIGDGMAYVQDLPFVDDDLRSRLIDHIDNVDIHVTRQEKQFWSNKINVDDISDQTSGELVDETLVLNRL